MIQTTTQVLNNVLYGISFGYSSCCIEYFHLRQVNGDMFEEFHKPQPKSANRKLDGTGFIACPQCESNFSKEEIIDSINENRYVANTFPSKGVTEMEYELRQHLLTEDIVWYTFNKSVSTIEENNIELINDID